MKTTVLAILAVILPAVLTAQQPAASEVTASGRGMVLEFRGGYSLPLGAFASDDREKDNSGYAGGGWMAGASFSWLGKHGIGLGLSYSYLNNRMNHGVSLVYPNGVPDSIDPGSWSNHFVLAGPVFIKQIDRLHLEARLMGGFVVSAGSLYDTRNVGDTVMMKIDQNIATGFGLEIGAGVGYYLTDMLAIKFNLALMAGWTTMSREYPRVLLRYDETIDPNTGLPIVVPIYSGGGSFEVKKTITALEPTLGLVLRF